jgi:hypothetical protein
MRNRFVCNVLSDMRKLLDEVKPNNASEEQSLLGTIEELQFLVEEAQKMVNSMENGLKLRKSIMTEHGIEDYYQESKIIKSKKVWNLKTCLKYPF